MRCSLVTSGFCVLVLVSCVSQTGLAPGDVLGKAATASRNLQSVNFNGNGTLQIGKENQKADIQIQAQGSLQDEGKQTQLLVTLGGTFTDKKQDYAVHGNAEIIVAGPDEIYLNVHSLETTPAHPLLNQQMIKNLGGQWWKLPAGTKKSASISPDPSLLRAQSEVVKVSKNYGIEKIDGTDAYHYDVLIDKDKLLAFLQKTAQEKGELFETEKARQMIGGFDAKGSVWVDASTFFLHKIMWSVAPVSPATDSYAFTLELNFTGHNAAAAISPPAKFNIMSPNIPLQTPVSSR
ncbi:MAG: hypothetical protein JWM56_228 [Candidatus Peribacteria bacterium]|nr:hypothetical protein [Candidatus Peribacteria bacterium]